MATTAEGVETRSSSTRVTLAGCTEVQGYLFSPAVPGGAVARSAGFHGREAAGPRHARTLTEPVG